MVKTSETGCSLVELFFSYFLSLRTDSFLDNIAPQHISVLKYLFVKAAAVDPVVYFSLATCIGAMDVLLLAGQCPVCLSHSPGTLCHNFVITKSDLILNSTPENRL